VSFERQPIADHANNLASTIQTNLKRSLEAIGVVRAPAGRPARGRVSTCIKDAGRHGQACGSQNVTVT